MLELDNSYKLFFSGLGIAIILFAFAPYIGSILKGESKPHVFSWVIWTLTGSIVFFAQLAAEGGAGAWPVGFTAILCGIIAVLAFKKRADSTIKKIDWLFFYSALAALPLWYFTDDPLTAVIILTLVDLFGFLPTLRKSYHQPYEESALFFFLYTLQMICAILAVEAYSLATLFFQIVIGIACFILVAMLIIRRRSIPKPIS
jgi:hypothetical protein